MIEWEDFPGDNYEIFMPIEYKSSPIEYISMRKNKHQPNLYRVFFGVYSPLGSGFNIEARSVEEAKTKAIERLKEEFQKLSKLLEWFNEKV